MTSRCWADPATWSLTLAPTLWPTPTLPVIFSMWPDRYATVMKTTQAAIMTAMSVGSPRASERLKTTSAATPMSAMSGVS